MTHKIFTRFNKWFTPYLLILLLISSYLVSFIYLPDLYEQVARDVNSGVRNLETQLLPY